MKCLVFSDSHGYQRVMRTALKMHPDAEVVFFLGDGLSDLEELSYNDSSRAYVCVRGNCDRAYTFQNREVKKVESINLSGYNIVLTHGDLYGAKYGMGGLISLARSEGADILLYGHTHTPHEEYVSDEKHPIYLFNPGSASVSGGSFGVITLGKTPLFSHGAVL